MIIAIIVIRHIKISCSLRFSVCRAVSCHLWSYLPNLLHRATQFAHTTFGHTQTAAAAVLIASIKKWYKKHNRAIETHTHIKPHTRNRSSDRWVVFAVSILLICTLFSKDHTSAVERAEQVMGFYHASSHYILDQFSIAPTCRHSLDSNGDERAYEKCMYMNN